MRREHLALTVWTVLVVVLLLLPGGLLSGSELAGVAKVAGIPNVDKLVHAFLFGVLAWLASGSFRRLGARRPVMLALLAAVLLGGMLELIQPMVDRSGELEDALADGGGALLAAALWGRGGRSRAGSTDPLGSGW